MITRNPELLRYVRSELRPARVAVIMLSALGGALLMALFIFQNSHPQELGPDYWRSVHGAIFLAASMILLLWSLLNVSQSVVSERTHRTFDFWRTTRLSPLTLALGKLFGAPLGPWLLYATTLPVLLFTGMMAHFRLSAIVGSYLVVALFNVALNAIALCGSARAQDSRRATLFMLLAVIGLLPMLNVSIGSHDGAMGVSAWSALNPGRPWAPGWTEACSAYRCSAWPCLHCWSPSCSHWLSLPGAWWRWCAASSLSRTRFRSSRRCR